MDKTGKEHEIDSKRHPLQAHFRIGIYYNAIELAKNITPPESMESGIHIANFAKRKRNEPVPVRLGRQPDTNAYSILSGDLYPGFNVLQFLGQFFLGYLSIVCNLGSKPVAI